MAKGSKSEYQDSQRRNEEKTHDELKESKDVVDDAGQAKDDWESQNAPSLTDTADALNSIAQELKADIQSQHGEQAESTDQAVDTQRQEVSDPARQDEQVELQAGDALDQASQQSKRFAKRLSEASDSRKDAENFLKELADTDEQSQAESQENLNDHRKSIEQTIQDIRDL